MTSVIDSCRIPPPWGAPAELSLPLSYLDMPWPHFNPIRRLLFYEFPCSRADFLETIVPKLKESLSIALKHYFPLAGNLLYPLNKDKKPIIRYVSGDSVLLTLSESSSDFDNLVANHARDADQLYDLVPPSPPLKEDPEYKIVPVFAVKATVFPGSGLCLGFANHHCVGDASSIVGFIKAWASISKHGGDEDLLEKQGISLPLFDRSVIKDPLGLDSIYWNFVKQIPLQSFSFPLPTDRVRATFVLSQSDINKLKNVVLAKKPELLQLSSFVVATTYVWTCFIKSGEEFEDDDLLGFPADIRSRLDPPVPANYFGNCLIFGIAKIRNSVLRGSEGFVMAATAAAEYIKNKINDKDEVLKGAQGFLDLAKEYMELRRMGVSGSPRFDLYDVDFGWGTARKLEVVSIDGEKYSMSLSRSRDPEGGLEVGLSLPKERMEAFAAIFADGLSKFS